MLCQTSLDIRKVDLTECLPNSRFLFKNRHYNRQRWKYLVNKLLQCLFHIKPPSKTAYTYDPTKTSLKTVSYTTRIDTNLVCSGRQQKPHHIQMPLITGQCKGTLLELIRVGVDARPVLQQDLSHTHMTGTGSFHQWRVSVLVVVFHVCPALQQDPHHCFVTLRKKEVQ